MIKKALIVYKKSAYESYFTEYRSPVMKKLALSGDKGLVHIKTSHSTHYQTLASVERALKSESIAYRRLPRGRKFNEKSYDLIVSVGGDGTFMYAARHLNKKPLLGVNSDTHHSVGKFCAVDGKNFKSYLKKIISAKEQPKKLQRLSLKLNGRSIGQPVINDLLVCHKSPAAMSHYAIELRGHRERQRSSGVWVATAAGSTGGIQSAGAKTLPLESKHFQYKPRELYEGHGQYYRYRGGIVPEKKIALISQMEEGVVYADGAHNPFVFPYGAKLEINVSSTPLLVYL